MSEPFAGKILVRGHTTIETSAFKQTDWDNDAATLPGQTVFAFTETGWDNDTSATAPVLGLRGVEDTWA